MLQSGLSQPCVTEVCYMARTKDEMREYQRRRRASAPRVEMAEAEAQKCGVCHQTHGSPPSWDELVRFHPQGMDWLYRRVAARPRA
jgi:cytochrome c553